MLSQMQMRWTFRISVSCLAGGVWLLMAAPGNWLDFAGTWGLVEKNSYGGETRKVSILETTGNGVLLFDYDADGDQDVLIPNGTTLEGGGDPAHLYRNLGAGKFEEVGRAAGFTHVGWQQAACAGDADNDGDADVVITEFGFDRFYRNLGGRFEDATAAAGFPTGGRRYGSGCTFVDYDRDGWLDLFVANYVDLDLEKVSRPGMPGHSCQWFGLPVMCGPRGLPSGRQRLFRNRGDGTFVEATEASGIARANLGAGLGVVASDFDDDGWPDLYVACDMTPSLLYRNRRDGTFEERGEAAGVAFNADGKPQAGMGVAVADFDGDGRFDIVKTNFSGDSLSLYRNEDGRFFSDVARERGLRVTPYVAWGIAFVDLDDDGWKDLVWANGHVYPELEGRNLGEEYRQPLQAARNDAGRRFVDVGAALGEAFTVKRTARGLALGDLDGDGAPEIVLSQLGMRPAVLRREGVRGNWLWLLLDGVKGNRDALGAKVTLRAKGRVWVEEVRGGASYYSQHERALTFSLGAAERVDSLEIRWPNGTKQVIPGFAVNRRIRVVEGNPEVQPLKSGG